LSDGMNNSSLTYEELASHFPSFASSSKPLVSLALCHTGAMNHTDLHNPSGFVPLFLSLGASTCIASTTPLLDKASQDFFTRFYHGIAAGGVPSEVFQQSQKYNMIKGDITAWAFIEYFGLA
ncbi:MAG: CHAT domain-containing protein, partial [Candidatus Sericytochromatia bacterium]